MLSALRDAHTGRCEKRGTPPGMYESLACRGTKGTGGCGGVGVEACGKRGWLKGRHAQRLTGKMCCL